MQSRDMRRQLIALRAEELRIRSAENARLIHVANQLRIEVGARLEQLRIALDLHAPPHGIEPTVNRSQRSQRYIPLDVLMAAMLSTQVDTNPGHHSTSLTGASEVSVEHLRALEEQTEELQRATVRLSAASAVQQPVRT